MFEKRLFKCCLIYLPLIRFCCYKIINAPLTGFNLMADLCMMFYGIERGGQTNPPIIKKSCFFSLAFPRLPIEIIQWYVCVVGEGKGMSHSCESCTVWTATAERKRTSVYALVVCVCMCVYCQKQQKGLTMHSANLWALRYKSMLQKCAINSVRFIYLLRIWISINTVGVNSLSFCCEFLQVLWLSNLKNFHLGIIFQCSD